MTEKANGYEAFQEGPAAGDLHRLAELAKLMFEAETAVESAEVELKKRKGVLRGIAERDIPELMEQCGVTEYATTTGLKLTIKRLLRASISKANLTAAVTWLDKHGHGGIVKRKVLVEFTRDQEAEAKKAATALLKKGFENVQQTYAVNAQTLGAWVRERRANGEAIPEKLLGVSEHTIAKVSTK